jgi:hypothetical protein
MGTKKNPVAKTGFLFASNLGRPLGLGDFSGLDAACADADALGMAIYQGLDGLEIDIPTAPGDVVRVRDVVTELRAFAANIAYLCHDFAPDLWCFVPPGKAFEKPDRPQMSLSTGSASGAHADTHLRRLAECLVYPGTGRGAKVGPPWNEGGPDFSVGPKRPSPCPSVGFDRSGIFDVKRSVADRAAVALAVCQADNPRPAGRALAQVLAHAEDGAEERRHNAHHDHGNADKDSPAEKAQQDARNDEDRGDDQAQIHAAKRAAGWMMFMDGGTGFLLHFSAAVRAEGPGNGEVGSAFCAIRIHKATAPSTAKAAGPERGCLNRAGEGKPAQDRLRDETVGRLQKDLP